MRCILILLAALLGTASYASAEDKAVQSEADWFFGCRIPQAGESAEDQPCWVQSRTIPTVFEDGTKGKLYFQVHFFPTKKILRVYIQESKVRFLVPVVDIGERGGVKFPHMKLIDCGKNDCWGDEEINDRDIAIFSSSHSLSLVGASRDDKPREGWILGKVITFSNFAESIALLRDRMEEVENRR